MLRGLLLQMSEMQSTLDASGQAAATQAASMERALNQLRCSRIESTDVQASLSPEAASARQWASPRRLHQSEPTSDHADGRAALTAAAEVGSEHCCAPRAALINPDGGSVAGSEHMPDARRHSQANGTQSAPRDAKARIGTRRRRKDAPSSVSSSMTSTHSWCEQKLDDLADDWAAALPGPSAHQRARSESEMDLVVRPPSPKVLSGERSYL